MYQESEEGICPYPDEIRDRLWGGLGIDSVSMSQEVSRPRVALALAVAQVIVVMGYEP